MRRGEKSKSRLLCGPGFLIGSLTATNELFMSLFSRVTVNTNSLYTCNDLPAKGIWDGQLHEKSMNVATL